MPEVLLSGDHAKVDRWRREQALRRTWLRRPDMLASAELTEADRAFLATLGMSKAAAENAPSEASSKEKLR